MAVGLIMLTLMVFVGGDVLVEATCDSSYTGYFKIGHFSNSGANQNVIIVLPKQDAEAAIAAGFENLAYVNAWSPSPFSLSFTFQLNDTATQDICNNHPQTACASSIPGAASCTFNNTQNIYTCCCNDGFESLSSCSSIGTAGHPCYGGASSSPDNFYKINCTDIDECSDTTICDVNATTTVNNTCANFPGGYTCDCIPGYRWDNSTQSCEDIDECTENSTICDPVASSCRNTDGSYECDCKANYVARGPSKQSCILDLCTIPTSNCSSQGNCSFDPSSNTTTCTCNSGYESAATTPVDDCLDIDECSTLTTPCNTGATCNNTDGSYECYCNSTAHMTPDDSSETNKTLYTCSVDNCSKNSSFCGTGAMCTNLPYADVENCNCTNTSKPYGDPTVSCNPDPCIGYPDCNVTGQECYVENWDLATFAPYCRCIVGYSNTSANSSLLCTYTSPCSTTNYGGCDHTSTVCLDEHNNGTTSCECARGYENNNGTHCDPTYVCTNTSFAFVIPPSSPNIFTQAETCFATTLGHSLSDLHITYNATNVTFNENVMGTTATVVNVDNLCVLTFDGDQAALYDSLSHVKAFNCFASQLISAGLDKCNTGTFDCNGTCTYKNGYTACCNSGTPQTARFKFDHTFIGCDPSCNQTGTNCTGLLNSEMAKIATKLNVNSICPATNHIVNQLTCSSNGLIFEVNNAEFEGVVTRDILKIYYESDVEDVDECTHPYFEQSCPQSCRNTIGDYGCMCLPGVSENNGVCDDALKLTCLPQQVIIELNAGFAAATSSATQQYHVNGMTNDSNCVISSNSVTVGSGDCGVSLTVQNGSFISSDIQVSNVNSSLMVNTNPVTFTFKCSGNTATTAFALGQPSSNVSVEPAKIINLPIQVLQSMVNIVRTTADWVPWGSDSVSGTTPAFYYFRVNIIPNAQFPESKVLITKIVVGSDDSFTQNATVLDKCEFAYSFGSASITGSGTRNVVLIQIPHFSFNSNSLAFKFTTKLCNPTCQETCDDYTVASSRKRRDTKLANRVKREEEDDESVSFYKTFLIQQASENTKYYTNQSTLMFALIAVVALLMICLVTAAVIFAVKRNRRSTQAYAVEDTHMNMYAINHKTKA